MLRDIWLGASTAIDDLDYTKVYKLHDFSRNYAVPSNKSIRGYGSFNYK